MMVASDAARQGCGAALALTAAAMVLWGANSPTGSYNTGLAAPPNLTPPPLLLDFLCRCCPRRPKQAPARLVFLLLVCDRGRVATGAPHRHSAAVVRCSCLKLSSPRAWVAASQRPWHPPWIPAVPHRRCTTVAKPE